jgi:hypothetical protein
VWIGNGFIPWTESVFEDVLFSDFVYRGKKTYNIRELMRTYFSIIYYNSYAKYSVSTWSTVLENVEESMKNAVLSKRYKDMDIDRSSRLGFTNATVTDALKSRGYYFKLIGVGSAHWELTLKCRKEDGLSLFLHSNWIKDLAVKEDAVTAVKEDAVIL